MASLPSAIKDVYRTAATEKAKYPRLAQLLAHAGVRMYVVDVATGTITYCGAQGSDTHRGEASRSVAPSFSQEKTIAALRATQAGTTDYPAFLDAIAAAGVQAYLADLEHARVIYMGHGRLYEEAIPSP